MITTGGYEKVKGRERQDTYFVYTYKRVDDAKLKQKACLWWKSVIKRQRKRKEA